MSNACPFCGGAVDADQSRCTLCGRSPSVPRRVCPKCGGMSPIAEKICVHCKHAFVSDAAWKIPLIIGLFLVAFVLAVVIQLLQ